jgi:hypothetical protein
MTIITVSDNTGSTLGGIEDNELDQFSPDTNKGSDTQAYIDAWVAPDYIVTLALRIPLPTITDPIEDAVLDLFLTDKGGAKTALSVFELLRTDWSESQSTFNIYKTGNNWSSGGAQGVGTDRDNVTLATADVASISSGNYVPFTGSGLIDLIQNAVDASATELNLIVQFTDLSFTSASYVRFRTSEGADGERPRLTITLGSGVVNIDCIIGEAVASGLSATIDQQQNITCEIGTAVASGLLAGVDNQLNIDCSIGTAIATGLTATVSGDNSIECAVGAAEASGLSATIDQQQNITCAIGTATASGLSTSVDQQQNITCSIGTAVASGLTATLSSDTIVTCSVGVAQASGLNASIDQQQNITCIVGTAIASGLTASLAGETTITCSIGTAIASGLSAMVDRQVNILCAIGTAIASGLEVSFEAEGRLKQAIKEAYASAPAGTIIIHTLEFRHPNFRDASNQPTAIRVVLGHQNLEAKLEDSAPQNAGEYVVFVPMAFELELPNVEHLAVPEISISMDNVSREIEDNLTLAAASPYKIEVTYRPYLNTDLTQPQMNPPLTMTLISAEADDFRVSARATYGNASNVLAPREVYTADRFPGLQR